MPPEEAACFRIIFDYHEGRLSLEEAAPLLQAAFRANPRGINLDISPSIRRLIAEVAKLEGRPAPFLGPIPERHAEGGKGMLLNLAAEAWDAVSHHPRAGELLSIGCNFAAAAEPTANRIVEWLRAHGLEHVRLQSPSDADSDDWIINAHTSPTRWSQSSIEAWAETIRAAPLAGEASFTGWGL
jgi:hypothetical protein